MRSKLEVGQKRGGERAASERGSEGGKEGEVYKKKSCCKNQLMSRAGHEASSFTHSEQRKCFAEISPHAGRCKVRQGR